MLELRFPWLWMGFGWLLVAAVCLGSLLPINNVDTGLSDKWLHFASYFALTVWFCGLYATIGYYSIITAIVIAFGAVLDVAQGATGTRTFDLLDILANALGAVVGFVLVCLVLGGWCAKFERWIAR